MSPLRAFRRPRLWLRLWIAALAASVVVSLLPSPDLELHVRHGDKLAHGVGYFALATYAVMLFATRRAMGLAALGLLALGLAIEGLQALVPWRSGDVRDLLANAIGVASGSALWFTPAARFLLWWDKKPAG